MNLKDLQKPLEIKDIDFRVQSINKGGYATILAYKDARVDMQRLDEVCTPLNWKREHTRDNKNCIVSIWCDEKKEWISKEDTGTESNTEQAKGLASDSFKRACFNWGIGRELYDYPVIQIKLKSDEWELKEYQGKKFPKATYNLKLKEWKWESDFVDGKITKLIAIDNLNAKRYEFGKEIKPPKTENKKEIIKPEVLAIAEMNECKSIDDLKAIWTKHKELQSNKLFVAAKDSKKKELTK